MNEYIFHINKTEKTEPLKNIETACAAFTDEAEANVGALTSTITEKLDVFLEKS